MSDVPGAFAGYRIGRQLSVDTVSTTHRATPQRRSGRRSRPVAVRISRPLRDNDTSDVATASDFLSALTDATAVTHPAFVTIIDAAEVGDRVYVVTEQIAGPTLDQYVRDHGPLDVARAVALLRPLAEGMDLAHAAGVVHGAISPRTIVIDKRADAPLAMLGGFGLAPLLARQIRQDRAAADVLDVMYVAPEQLGGAPIDGRVDQYALACALYHCVVGRPPFVRDSVAALFGAHLFSAAHVPADRATPVLAHAVQVGLAKRPHQRHASCATLLTAADGRGSTSGDPVASTPSPDGGPAPVTPSISEQAAIRREQRRMHRRLPIPWPVAAMLVVAGILCTLALAAILRDGRATDETSSGVGAQVSNGVSVADPGAQARTAPAVPATVEWARRLGDAPIAALAPVGDAVAVASQGTVTALDAGGGGPRWRRSVGMGPIDDLVASSDAIGVHAAGLHVLSGRDGTLRWADRDVLAPLAAPTADDRAFFGIRMGRPTPTLIALDAAGGNRMWQFDDEDGALGGAATIAVAGKRVAVLTEERLVGIDMSQGAPNGQLTARWSVDLIDPWVEALAVGTQTVVVAGRDGRVCAYAFSDGDQRWCADIVGMTDREPTIVVNDAAVAVAMPSHVTLLERQSGQLRLSFGVPDLLPLAVAQGDQVVVAERSGTLHGFDTARGYDAWRASGLGDVTALAADDEAAYAGTADGRVVRIRPARGTAPPG